LTARLEHEVRARKRSESRLKETLDKMQGLNSERRAAEARQTACEQQLVALRSQLESWTAVLHEERSRSEKALKRCAVSETRRAELQERYSADMGQFKKILAESQAKQETAEQKLERRTQRLSRTRQRAEQLSDERVLLKKEVQDLGRLISRRDREDSQSSRLLHSASLAVETAERRARAMEQEAEKTRATTSQLAASSMRSLEHQRKVTSAQAHLCETKEELMQALQAANERELEADSLRDELHLERKKNQQLLEITQQKIRAKNAESRYIWKKLEEAVDGNSNELRGMPQVV
jgi:chromosome segregation ATPase